MSFVPGDSLEPLFDLDGDLDDALVAERLRSACRLLASLHSIAPVSVGLGDEPVVGAPEEIERWVRLLETVDPALAPGWSEVAHALRSASVEPMAPAIVHGDFRLGNMLAVDGSVTALIDWETGPWATRASTSAGSSSTPTPRPTGARAAAGRLPTPAELAERYAEALGRPVPGLAFLRGPGLLQVHRHLVAHRQAQPSP